MKEKDKKVGIISIHYGVNFGSSLQAIALSNYIKETNANIFVEVINYIPERFRLAKRLFSLRGGFFSDIIRGLVRLIRFERVNRKYVAFIKANTKESLI